MKFSDYAWFFFQLCIFNFLQVKYEYSKKKNNSKSFQGNLKCLNIYLINQRNLHITYIRFLIKIFVSYDFKHCLWIDSHALLWKHTHTYTQCLFVCFFMQKNSLFNPNVMFPLEQHCSEDLSSVILICSFDILKGKNTFFKLPCFEEGACVSKRCWKMLHQRQEQCCFVQV